MDYHGHLDFHSLVPHSLEIATEAMDMYFSQVTQYPHNVTVQLEIGGVIAPIACQGAILQKRQRVGCSKRLVYHLEHGCTEYINTHLRNVRIQGIYRSESGNVVLQISAEARNPAEHPIPHLPTKPLQMFKFRPSQLNTEYVVLSNEFYAMHFADIKSFPYSVHITLVYNGQQYTDKFPGQVVQVRKEGRCARCIEYRMIHNCGQAFTMPEGHSTFTDILLHSPDPGVVVMDVTTGVAMPTADELQRKHSARKPEVAPVQQTVQQPTPQPQPQPQLQQQQQQPVGDAVSMHLAPHAMSHDLLTLPVSLISKLLPHHHPGLPLQHEIKVQLVINTYMSPINATGTITGNPGDHIVMVHHGCGELLKHVLAITAVEVVIRTPGVLQLNVTGEMDPQAAAVSQAGMLAMLADAAVTGEQPAAQQLAAMGDVTGAQQLLTINPIELSPETLAGLPDLNQPPPELFAQLNPLLDPYGTGAAAVAASAGLPAGYNANALQPQAMFTNEQYHAVLQALQANMMVPQGNGAATGAAAAPAAAAAVPSSDVLAAQYAYVLLMQHQGMLASQGSGGPPEGSGQNQSQQ